MGLIKAGIGAIGSVLADQWKEYFVCDAIPKNIIMTRGQKQTSSRSSNTKGNDNVISDGSGIQVSDGQCMIIVENGKVVELCAEPGVYTYNNSVAPSIFTGKLGDSIKNTFSLIGKRFTYGGDVGADQRVYYFNTKELIDTKFGTPNPVMFRVVDLRSGLDLEVNLRCSGLYSYKVVDPILFYTNVCGNVSTEYAREEIDVQLKAEFIAALQKGLGKLSALGVRPSEVIGHTDDLEEGMNEALNKKWGEDRGLKICSIALESVTLPEEDKKAVQDFQKAATLAANPSMAAGRQAEAWSSAMENASKNEAGAATGFMGMGMAMNMGGQSNISNLYAMGAQQQQAQAQAPQAQQGPQWTCGCGNNNPATAKCCSECGKPRPTTDWTCECGTSNAGKFCSNCGKPKPSADWTCECGTTNSGKFCSNCGKPRP